MRKKQTTKTKTKRAADRRALSDRQDLREVRNETAPGDGKLPIAILLLKAEAGVGMARASWLAGETVLTLIETTAAMALLREVRAKVLPPPETEIAVAK